MALIDNKNQTMYQALINALSASDKVDIQVGYFYFSGFELLATHFKDIKTRKSGFLLVNRLTQKRARALYKAKGYPEDWIERRMRSIAIREELTDEWQKHGVELAKEYEILTAEISKATFGVTPSEYKKIKGLRAKTYVTI